jgi:site-specific DNA-cytosine methylase
MKKKLILDLCGGTGSWSKPYKEAGYKVINITLPEHDVTKAYIGTEYIEFPSELNIKNNKYVRIKDVYGILAAPPCTHFSIARTNAKKPRDLNGAMKIVHFCLKIIHSCQYGISSSTQRKPPLTFWALENPRGLLNWFLGKAPFEFDPYDFGDNYRKRTCIWGNFNFPTKNPIECTMPKFDKLKTKDIHGEEYGKLTRQERRAITPQGFAKAFFEANK